MAVKASENFKVYKNKKGPTISTVTRKVIEKDKLYFKDIDGTGKLSAVNDWRLPAAQRAAAYVKLLTVDEKLPSCSSLTGGWVPNIRIPGWATMFP